MGHEKMAEHLVIFYLNRNLNVSLGSECSRAGSVKLIWFQGLDYAWILLSKFIKPAILNPRAGQFLACGPNV